MEQFKNIKPMDKVVVEMINYMIDQGTTKSKIQDFFNRYDVSPKARQRLLEKYNELYQMEIINKQKLEANQVSKNVFEFLGLDLNQANICSDGLERVSKDWGEKFKSKFPEIDKEVDTWIWFDSTLFKLYKNTPMSYRKLSDETRLSLLCICNTIKSCKKKLKNKFPLNYLDYINEFYPKGVKHKLEM